MTPFRSGFRRYCPKAKPSAKRGWELVERSRGRLTWLVLFHDGKACAYVTWRKNGHSKWTWRVIKGKEPKTTTVEMLFLEVKQHYQGSGLGAFLLTEMLKRVQPCNLVFVAHPLGFIVTGDVGDDTVSRAYKTGRNCLVSFYRRVLKQWGLAPRVHRRDNDRWFSLRVNPKGI